MWDPSNSDQNRPGSSRRTPSPAFPSPQYANPTYTPTSYPGHPSYMPMLMPVPNIPTPPVTLQAHFSQYYPQRLSPVPEAIPRSPYQVAPSQVIIIKKSHKRRRDGRHRGHSHSHSSQPIVIPQPIINPNYDSQAYYTIPTTVNYLEPRHQIPHRHSNGSLGHVQSVVPQIRHSHSAIPVSAKNHTSHPGGFLCSNCTGRKKALCIGINYSGQNHALRGCVNDANNVRKWLIKYHGFRSEDIILLTDNTSERRHLPTRQNLIDAMKWLVRSARTHDSLFFHYSGHGGQVEDQDGDEIDGFDEAIFPLDYKKAGVILDDELYEIMVSRLPTGCRLTALFDSCHSGTVLDLPYIYSCQGRLKGEHVAGPWRKRRATQGDVISWSGCKDGETSADTFHDGVAVGAMSNAFISTLKQRPNQSYQELLHSVRQILGPKYNQTPQLGSSHPMDISRRFIV